VCCMLTFPVLYLLHDGFSCSNCQKCICFEPHFSDYSGMYQMNKDFSRGV
jgi:hypothetical protein